jgi:hypothetical protein
MQRGGAECRDADGDCAAGSTKVDPVGEFLEGFADFSSSRQTLL